MNSRLSRCAAILFLWMATFASAQELTSLQVHPSEVKLLSADETCQLIITGVLAQDGRLQDLTGDAVYDIADPRLVRVTPQGRVLPLASGQTTITVRQGDKSARIPVMTQSIEDNLPINFPNQIVPIFSKLGCSGGGCHGKSGGQNGFALSLLGFVPELDYQTLVKEDRGRRLFPAAPDASLLLVKGTGQVPHGGGGRMGMDSAEYKLVRRWIAAGTPFGEPSDPVVTKITAYPEHRILMRNGRQQFAIYAHYSDGRIEDVSQRAVFESNDIALAVIDSEGLVRSLDQPGEVALMARYQDHVTSFRVTVPLGLKTPEYKFEYQTAVDRHIHRKWQELGVVPSDLCTDEEFLRRVALDLTGTLPTPEQVVAFLKDTSPKKRESLVERLLETPEYSYYFTNRWADVLRVRRGNDLNNRAPATFSFHNWIRNSIAADKPYDEFVREIVCATGDHIKSPPTMWYRDLLKPERLADDFCQVFLGVRLACAQCHHHPYEKWSQDDYWSMAAFFGNVARRSAPIPGLVLQNQPQVRFIIMNLPNTVVNPRTQKKAFAKALDEAPANIKQGEDPRVRLADWMTDPQNPFFARAVANRYWAHFFGRGIVDPVDDMRVTNPPSNPALLDELAKTLIDNKYSLKALIRTIVLSRAYQLSVDPNEFNKHDKRSFARFYPRRLSAEVLFDAVAQMTGGRATFPGLPADQHAPYRAIMLPDESFASYFLDVFGRPQRISACECERVTQANLAQTLHLLNSKEVHDMLMRVGGRADRLASDPRPDTEKVDELFLAAFARKPTPGQTRFALEKITARGPDKKSAYEDILWALINTKEFILVQ